MKMMPRMIAAVAIVAMCGIASTAQAQAAYSDGYSFGSGIGNSFPYPGNVGGFSAFGGFGGVGLAQRFEEPPYFAKYPPVYYSHIVRRPYGISPYAAPPGIAPVEMQYSAKPVKVVNPHFLDSVVPPVEAPTPAAPVPPPMLDDQPSEVDILAEAPEAAKTPKKKKKPQSNPAKNDL